MPRNQCLSYSTGLTHRGYGNRNITQVPAIQGPRTEKGNWTWSLTSNQGPICNCHLRVKGKLVFAKDSHLLYKPHLGVGPMPSCRWPTQMDSMVFLYTLSHIALFGLSCLTDLLLVYYAFWFCGFMDSVCVWMFKVCLVLLFVLLPVCFLKREKKKRNPVQCVRWLEASGRCWERELWSESTLRKTVFLWKGFFKHKRIVKD